MKEKHFFAGNNTSEGFFSYFDYLLDPSEAEHVYILKGGPGVGKNHFMKKFANEMKKKGCSIEYIHCSSDNVSLDGILISELKVLFVDGTAPHVIDPLVPGAVDEIVNLGSFLNSQELKKHKAAIMEVSKAKSNYYISAYRYLSAAGKIYDEICSIYDSYMDTSKFNQLCEDAIYKLFKGSRKNKRGRLRKLFTESFTANGYVSHTELFFEHNEVWAVVGKDTNYTPMFLEKILEEALNRGHDIECYYRPLNPSKPQHIYLPEKKLIIVTAENPMNINYKEVFDLYSIIDAKGIKSQISEIENNLHLYDLLIKNSLEKLSSTKKCTIFWKLSMLTAWISKVLTKSLTK
ncbi:MAG TPA: hypothetical protein GX396_09355 [Tissierellia bacterium]|nr:hypothetical protein [Tissierellia bacterium]